jgi:hypothetical protein
MNWGLGTHRNSYNQIVIKIMKSITLIIKMIFFVKSDRKMFIRSESMLGIKKLLTNKITKNITLDITMIYLTKSDLNDVGIKLIRVGY